MDVPNVRESSFASSLNPTDVLRAEFYVALHRGSPGDVEFYRAACLGVGRVLELGCGDGRVLFELCDVLANGAEAPALVGLDCDEGMLALAERRAQQLALADSVAAERLPALVRGDMRDFDVAGQFDRIIVPYCGLWCLPDADKLSCLRATLRHLAPGGELYFDVYDAEGMDEDVQGDEEPIEDDYELVATVQLGPGQGDSAEQEAAEVRSQQYDVFEKNCYWFRDRVVEVTFDYRVRAVPGPVQNAVRGPVQNAVPSPVPSSVTTQVIRHHYLECDELLSLLKRAGFGRAELLDGSDRETSESGQLFFRCSAS